MDDHSQRHLGSVQSAHPNRDNPALLMMYEELVAGLPLAVYRAEVGLRGRCTFMSQPIEQITGYPAHRWIEDPDLWFRRVHPDDRDRIVDEELAAARTDAAFASEYRVKHREGNWIWVRDRAQPVDDRVMQGVIIDITLERQKEESFRLLFDHNPLPMWVYDLEDLSFQAVNSAAIEHYGYSREEFLAMRITDIRAPEDIAVLMNNLADPRKALESTGPWRHITKVGDQREVEIRSHVIDFGGFPAVLVVAEDVTDRRRAEGEREALEAHLRQAQKMHSLGKLAGGIAHDFNNILGVIINYGEFVRDELTDKPAALDDLGEILKAADHGASLVRQLLLFSRKEIVRPESLDLNEVVRDVLKLLRRSLGADIDISINLADELPAILIDRSQLEQAIINLAVNARDAMPRGGKLLIGTSTASFEDETVAGHPEMTPGRYVCLSVADTGNGIPPEIQEKIFDPFFTTKRRGQGTGLGLATVYGVVHQAEGSIYVYSEPDQGTTFRVYLPASSDPTAPQSATDVAAEEKPSGDELILVVEDNDSMRESTCRILTQAGFEVSAHHCPQAAFEALDKMGTPDVVLTDVVLPGMSGRIMAGRIKAALGPLPVVFMSGYSEELLDERGHLDEGETLLQKPFSARNLLRTIRTVLDAT
jgi:PAS domain S-box-containing protein